MSSNMMTPDITKDNIYLKGGNNIAEALKYDMNELGIKKENS